MKKIIKNLLYSTETAKELGSWGNNLGYRDFGHMTETLYQKRTGEFFLHGEGGPMTKYAESAGQNTWTGGERIIPLSVESARKWAEEHLSVDEYEKIFGLPEETEDKVNLGVQIPADLSVIVRRQAAEREMTLTAYITQILREHCMR